MPSLCSGLVTRIPDRPEFVRPKRGTANGGDVMQPVLFMTVCHPPPFPRTLGKEGKKARDRRESKLEQIK